MTTKDYRQCIIYDMAELPNRWFRKMLGYSKVLCYFVWVKGGFLSLAATFFGEGNYVLFTDETSASISMATMCIGNTTVPFCCSLILTAYQSVWGYFMTRGYGITFTVYLFLHYCVVALRDFSVPIRILILLKQINLTHRLCPKRYDHSGLERT